MKQLLVTLSLLLLLVTALVAEQFTISDNQNGVRLISSNDSEVVLEMTLGHFNREAVSINGETWYHLNLKKEGLTLEAGMPQVPVIARSVIIPATSRMELSTLQSEYVDILMPVAPSKGNLTRDIDPNSVPYTFSSFYSSGQQYPALTAQNTEPFVIRDYRGMTIRFTPFVYLPATQTLRVYTRLRVALSNNGTDLTNALSTSRSSYSAYFEEIYKGMFLNFESSKYPTLEENGKILVIKHSMFDDAIDPYIEWKRQNGLTVDIVDVSVAGPTANQIQAFIANRYNQDPELTFVQIMGDAPQVPTLSSGGGGSDPSFALITGGDNYPEIFVGRFSAQTVAEMQTQVQRTIYYERDIQAGADWIQKAMGIASNEGGGSQGDMGESDQAHMELIRTDLLGYGYSSVDQLYQATGATAAQVSTNLNIGRGFVNYVGHGSNTSWSTTGFSNTNVNALTNDNMLPFIVSVACVNGNFVSITCFAEAWLRATNNTNGAPTGAVAHYASTINQSWNPPMRGQDEITDLLIAESKQTIGGLFFNGSSRMTEVYGADGVSMYKTWHIFGDASLMVRTKNPQELTANYTPVLFLGVGSFEVLTIPGARATLSNAGIVYGSAVANASGIATISIANPPQEPMNLTLTISAFNKVTHLGTVSVLPSTGPYVVVSETVVNDDNNNTAEYGETINLNVSISNVGSDIANDVSISLSSTDPYLTILTNQEDIGNIPANGTGETTTGFSIEIANNVPDQHTAQLNITISSQTDEWQYVRTLQINAPAFGFGTMTIDEIQGDGNGRIDAGETVQLTLPILNNGHAQGNDVMAVIMIDAVQNVADPIVNSFTAIPAGGSADIMYQVTFSSQIPMGTQVPITVILAAGEYSVTYNMSVVVGLMMEDFENGFGNYPWTFSGGDWTVDSTDPYNGSQSAKSATITHNQSTSMVVTMNVPEAGDISFYKKVSSEANYDYMKFYINNVLKNQWSGNVAWSQETYAVLPGNTTFKWEYMKDNIVSSGSDCAWVDNIVFPAVGGTAGAPIFTIDTESLDFGAILVGESAMLPLTINNVGSAVMIGTLSTTAPFYLVPAGGEPVSQLNYVVYAGTAVEIMVAFMPVADGTFPGFVDITSDDPGAPTTQISLLALANPVSNPTDVVPIVTELKGNYPNPFNPTTNIQYSIKEAGAVRIDVYNILGQKVRTLVDANMAAGNYNVTWNGKDQRNNNVASGIYFYKMQAGKYSSTKKMVLMK